MSLSHYAEYNETGTPWLAKVPAHWVSQRVKDFASFQGGGTPTRDNAEFWFGDIPWISPKDMKSERVVRAEECITLAGLQNSTTSLVPKQAVLMVVRSGILKHTIPVAVNEVPVALNQDMKALRFAARSCLPSFFLRWVQGLNDSLLLTWAKQGATVESIEHDYLANTRVPLPPLEEQAAIVAFLDRETAKIDALVAEQEKLIALLKEKRQAVISHAVTKGLDPDAPMKASGIEWLGDVPAHWEVRALRSLSRVVRGSSPRPAGDPEFFGGDHIPWVTVAEITKDDSAYLTSVSEFLTESGSRASRVFKSGTVIYSNSGATLGVPKILAMDACANDGVVGFEALDQELLPVFLYNFLRSLTQTIREMVKQGSGQPNLNTDIVKCTWIALPPIREQEAIAERIAHIDSSFADLITGAEQAIALLQERRSALISAAVTGKIDVRGTSR